MGKRGSCAIVVAAGALALPGSAAGARPPVEVDANGNPFTGGLSFDPAEVTVGVGEVVRWTNTDPYVPHTVTEQHRLFDLGGDYGAPPLTPTGFGPGESVEHRFAAGTFDYFCDIHPEMVGQVAALPRVRRAAGKRPRVIAVWGKETLPAGQVFDVQRNRGRGWRKVRDGTGELRGRFKARRRGEVAFRARVRQGDDPDRASGYSQPVSIAID